MNTRRRLPLLLLLLLWSAAAFAQKVPKSITKRDDRNIRAAATQTMESLVNLLNFVAEPENTSSDIDDAIANAFAPDSKTRVFFQSDFEADDDLDAQAAAENLTKDIKAYLRQFRNFYKQAKPLSIRYSVTEVSDIHIGEANLYLKVFFNQQMNGKDRDGKAFPSKMPKVAEMQILSIGGQWQTLISHLDRQSKADRSMSTPVVTISDAGGEGSADANGPQRSEAYYRTQLANGTRMLNEYNFTDAYYALKEAKRFPATEGEADARINDLKAKLRSQNQEPTDYLYSGLASKAESWGEKFRYDLAKNYYNYAKEVKPASAKSAAASILALSQIEAKQNNLYSMLDKGSYSEAVRGFTAAIGEEKDNPALYVGLGRAQAGLGANAEAEEAFANAVRLDANYPETYRARGAFYKDRKDYQQAYDAYAAYQTHAEDTADRAVLSDIAYCRGRLAQMKGAIPAAMEAYTSALSYNPDNVDVLVAQADLVRMQGEKGVEQAKKLIKEALRRNDKNPEAYAVRAQIALNEADKGGAADAYQQAIKWDKDNPQWYFELGKLQMELNEKTDGAAILTFTQCLNIRTVSRVDALKQIQALWKRGKCYYLQNRLDEAEADYSRFMKEAKMLTNPFYVDYANLLIKRGKYDEAQLHLAKAGQRPDALLSLGILNYSRNPGNEAGYEDYFNRAFRDGVSEEAVRAAPNMRQLYDNSSLVKGLVKKFYHGNTDF